MDRTRNAVLLALLVLLVLAFAGCGGDDSDEFREDYNAAVAELAKISTDIGSAAGDASEQSNAEIANEFNQIAATAGKTRAELADLDPPEDAKDEFDKLLDALDQGVGDLRSVARAAKADNPQKASRAAKKLARSGAEITEAEDALKKAVDG
jgi:23S rRNA A2030 N6-methylase RlmJ